jgi:starvation-inducible DNA-binding protein
MRRRIASRNGASEASIDATGGPHEAAARSHDRGGRMNQTASTAHQPSLGAHVRDEVGRTLQEELLELVDLSLVGKQLHWTVVGPHFRPLHLRLDELVDSWRELADVVAERAVALGYSPNGQVSALAAADLPAALDAAPLADELVVRELTTRLADLCERTRTRMDRLGELDAVSQDVLIDALRTLEEQLWMARAELEHTHTS